MEPRRGFEPPTYGLRYRCSTVELSRHVVRERRAEAHRKLMTAGVDYT